jgi:hypothetical protein
LRTGRFDVCVYEKRRSATSSTTVSWPVTRQRLTRIAVAQGQPEPEARAEARLGVGVVRGLLLDLLTTGEREAVDAAMERYIAAIAPPAT